MYRIVKYLKCKTCSQINQDYKWEHTETVKMDASSVTQREKFYCPNCLHDEYDEIEYKDLPKSFRYLMSKQRTRDTLKSLEDDCESTEQFEHIMESFGWKNINANVV